MRYMLLVQQYADIIEGQFYGHDHVDEVRVQNTCRYLRKFQLLTPAPPVLPLSQSKIHTRGNVWSFTVG